MRVLTRLLILFFTLSLGACATVDENDRSKWSAARYYQEAKEAMGNKNYLTAIELLEQLEGEFPFGPYAEQARLDQAFIHYKQEDVESALAATDRFIKLHPKHPQVDYAYYLRGLVLFEENQNFLYKTFNQDPAHRNPEGARLAYSSLAELVKRFPNSKYANDAKQRMLHLRNRLAAYEVYVGEFYLQRDAYLAAVNRGKYVVENYQNTEAVGDALALMVQAYRKMGMNKLAEDSLRVLVLNYPQHPKLLKLGK